MSSLYKQYLKLLERWPVDPTKTGRDLGEYLRHRVRIGFRNGQIVGDVRKCEENIKSLNRLADNFYLKQFPVSAHYTSCGLDANSCRRLVDNENLGKVPMGFFEKWILRWRSFRKPNF